MLLWIVPALISIALFIGTLRLQPPARRATLLPPLPRAEKG
jgi:hypothetical protein